MRSWEPGPEVGLPSFGAVSHTFVLPPVYYISFSFMCTPILTLISFSDPHPYESLTSRPPTPIGHTGVQLTTTTWLSLFAGGVYLSSSKFALSSLNLDGNSAFSGGALYVAADLASGVSLDALDFGPNNSATRGAAAALLLDLLHAQLMRNAYSCLCSPTHALPADKLCIPNHHLTLGFAGVQALMCTGSMERPAPPTP